MSGLRPTLSTAQQVHVVCNSRRRMQTARAVIGQPSEPSTNSIKAKNSAHELNGRVRAHAGAHPGHNRSQRSRARKAAALGAQAQEAVLPMADTVRCAHCPFLWTQTWQRRTRARRGSVRTASSACRARAEDVPRERTCSTNATGTTAQDSGASMERFSQQERRGDLRARAMPQTDGPRHFSIELGRLLGAGPLHRLHRLRSSASSSVPS